MNSELAQILRRRRQVIYTITDLQALMSGTSDGRKAVIKRAIADGTLIHIKRGLYYANPEITHKKPHGFDVAQLIYGPSSISLESALSYHNLIPEAVYTTTSVTIKRSKLFRTPLGHYEFQKVPLSHFFLGVERIAYDDTVFLMATPWRAMTDFVYCRKRNWPNPSALEADLRLDFASMPALTKKFAKQLADYYHNKRVNKFLNNMSEK